MVSINTDADAGEGTGDEKTLPTHTALEVFLRGFSTTRSFTRPYRHRSVEDAVWLLSDIPGGKDPERTPELVTYRAGVEAVQAAVQTQNIGSHFLCILLDDAQDAAATAAQYKAIGYRLRGREPFFQLHLSARKEFAATPIRRITTPEDARTVAVAARSRQILPEHLGEADAVCRLYAAYDSDGDTPIGWVRSIRTHPECTWVSNLYVDAAHRRKGIGRSLMSAMLTDDARFGVQWSVLLASLTGALLYPVLGYQQCGTLLLLHSPRNPGT